MPASREISELLRAVSAGERVPATRLTLLSGIDAQEADAVRVAWPGLPGEERERLLARVTELAEDNVDLDFSGLAMAVLGDESAAVRRLAVDALWEKRDRATARALRSIVARDPDESVRAAAATALAPFVLARELDEFDETEGAAVVEALREAANEDAEPSTDVRGRAIEALGARSLPWVETLINDAYYAEDQRTRLAAIRAMGASAQHHWFDFLEEQAQSDEPEFRYEAAAALGALGSDDALDILGDLLADEDAEVVVAAITALGEIGGDVAVDMLQAFAAQAEDAEPLSDAAQAALDAALSLEDQDLMRKGIGIDR